MMCSFPFLRSNDDDNWANLISAPRHFATGTCFVTHTNCLTFSKNRTHKLTYWNWRKRPIPLAICLRREQKSRVIGSQYVGPSSHYTCPATPPPFYVAPPPLFIENIFFIWLNRARRLFDLKLNEIAYALASTRSRTSTLAAYLGILIEKKANKRTALPSNSMELYLYRSILTVCMCVCLYVYMMLVPIYSSRHFLFNLFPLASFMLMCTPSQHASLFMSLSFVVLVCMCVCVRVCVVYSKRTKALCHLLANEWTTSQQASLLVSHFLIRAFYPKFSAKRTIESGGGEKRVPRAAPSRQFAPHLCMVLGARRHRSIPLWTTSRGYCAHIWSELKAPYTLNDRAVPFLAPIFVSCAALLVGWLVGWSAMYWHGKRTHIADLVDLVLVLVLVLVCRTCLLARSLIASISKFRSIATEP